MPGLPLWPDDHGQVIGQKSFSTGHRRSPMIDSLRLQIAAATWTRSCRVAGGVLSYLPCDQPSTPVLPRLALAEDHEHSLRSRSHSPATARTANFGTPLSIQNP